MQLAPIGVFHCEAQHSYEAPRQAVLGRGNAGHVQLMPGRNFEQALSDLEGFERIWLVYQFHQNLHWKPLVQPPRAMRKVGVFASRAPYRPNPIGLSCVELRAVRGLRVEVGAHDLLDGTPVLDIKPYLPYADSFPEARLGWLAEDEAPLWTVSMTGEADAQLQWLEARGVTLLRSFLEQQLCELPSERARKRVRSLERDAYEIAYRTWRARYRLDAASHVVDVIRLDSGYSAADLRDSEDPYGDKSLHERFIASFGR